MSLGINHYPSLHSSIKLSSGAFLFSLQMLKIPLQLHNTREPLQDSLIICYFELKLDQTEKIELFFNIFHEIRFLFSYSNLPFHSACKRSFVQSKNSKKIPEIPPFRGRFDAMKTPSWNRSVWESLESFLSSLRGLLLSLPKFLALNQFIAYWLHLPNYPSCQN